ncbi:hypothetical protein HK102_007397 [Quaeritorhiza haematococci]|nr:hypothetical protein HK102_007397 [Quaeritorhiza haematococci]
MSIPHVVKGDDVFIGAETGSGKTLAYLVPVINRLREEEEEAKKRGVDDASEDADVLPEMVSEDTTTSAAGSGLASLRKLRRPRAVIIVPTRELVSQVTQVAKHLSHSARFRVVGVHSKTPRAEIIESFARGPVDMLVSSPAALSKLMEAEGGKMVTAGGKKVRTVGVGLSLARTTCVVIDEADTMFDEGFGRELEKIVWPLVERNKLATQHTQQQEDQQQQEEERSNEEEKSVNGPRPCQFVIVSATLPKSVSNLLSLRFPHMRRIITPTLHRTVPTLRQFFLRLDGSTTKENLLIEILRRSFLKGDKRVLVFCNTKESVLKVGEFLRGKGYDAETLVAGDDMRERRRKLKGFLEGDAEEQNEKEGEKDEEGESDSTSKDKSKGPAVLVCTDLASRGLDTIAVRHVVLYDFPRSTIDYLHRVGRTARNGSSGQATSIITKRDVALYEAILRASRSKSALE